MFHPATDWADVVDGLQSVTLVSPAGEAVVVGSALQRAARAREPVAGAGQITQHDCTWHLPVAQLATRPALGTKLRDAAGDEWTILAVEQVLLGGVWKCRTRNIVLAHNLHARVVLEFPIYGRDQFGAATVVAWQVSKANVPARIQPVARQPGVMAGTVGDVVTHRVYLTEWDVPSAQSRVRDISGRIFAIERIERLDRLGELVELHVRRLA